VKAPGAFPFAGRGDRRTEHSPDPRGRASTKLSQPLRMVVVMPAALLDGLTEAQRRAVTTEAQPLCVLAGAGAGKTRVLTKRIAWRIDGGSADAKHVLALTFTRKAAGELAGRLDQLGVRDRVAAGTFHSTALAQLRRWWSDTGRPAPKLLDRKSRILAPIVSGRPGLSSLSLADLAGEIEWAKARMLGPDDFAAAAEACGRRLPAPADDLAALFSRYEHEKRRRRLVDFDDLLVMCADAIDCDPDFAAAQRWRWRHLFVDEYQDANALQERLLRAWLGGRADLCVVGDTNQAVYGWNGADPALLAEFGRRWPGAEVVRLFENHRCSPQVVAAAAAVLGAEGAGLSSTRPDGPAVVVKAYPTEQAEAGGIAAELRKAHSSGLAWHQLAVLARTNAQLGVIETTLRRATIPCQLSAHSGLLDQPSVRSALDQVRANHTGANFNIVVADLQDLDRRQAGRCPPDGSHPDGPPGDPGAARPVSTLLELARDYRCLDPSPNLGGWFAWLEVVTGADSQTGDKVALSTFHRAKGLEWRSVWVTGLERGLVPIGQATTPAAQHEERRLLYVALTRAESDLHCSWAARRSFGAGQAPREPSPWLTLIEGVSSGQALDAISRAGGRQEWHHRFGAERGRLARTVGTSPAGGPGGQLPPVDSGTLEALQDWRSATAKGSGVPPHVLFHDRTLAALAALKPRSTEELLSVPGLGPVKVARYGDVILGLVDQHRRSA
jgi:DNA helicase-2/ATP-dependent DNA helicase PcrA